jgi:hypothetical protein
MLFKEHNVKVSQIRRIFNFVNSVDEIINLKFEYKLKEGIE